MRPASFFSRMLTGIRMDMRTDGGTDIRTERPFYRDARTHLKMINSSTIPENSEFRVIGASEISPLISQKRER